MAKIDDLVLRLRFDNSKFRDSAVETMSMLDRLKDKMSFRKSGNPFKESAKGAKELQRAVQEVDLSKLASDVESIKSSFSTLGIIGRTALGKLTVDALNFGRKIVHNISQPLVGGGMRRAMNIERAEFMLKGLGANIESVMKSANEAVVGTAFSLDEAAKAGSQFFASGVAEGEEMTRTLLGISGVAAITSSSYGEIADIFTTVAGQGKLMSQQLNQFASRGLNVAATLAKYFEVSESELREMVTKSKVTFEDFSKAMTEAYGEHAKKAGETFEGSMANAKAPLARIGADVASVYLKEMTGLFNALKPFLDVIHGALKPTIEFINLVQTKSIRGATNFFNSLTEGLSKNGDLGWIGMIGQGIRNLLEQFDLLRDSINRAFVRQWTELGEGVRATVEKIAAAFLRFTETVKFSNLFLYNNARIFGALFAIVDTGWIILKSFATSILTIGDAIVRYVLPHVLTLIRYIARTVSWILRWIKSARLIEGAFGGVTAVIVGIIKAIGSLLEKMTEITDAVIRFMYSILEKHLGGTIFDPALYPEKHAQAFLKVLKDLGPTIAKIPTKGLEILKGLFSVVKTSASEFGKTMSELVKMIDFSWITKPLGSVKKAFGGFRGFKNPFSNFSGPKLDFDKANASVRKFGESLRQSIRINERLPWHRITEPIQSAFKKTSQVIVDIDWKGSLSKIWDGAKAGYSNIGERLRDTFGKAKESLSSIDWKEAGVAIVEKIGDGLKAAKDLTVSVAKSLSEALKKAVDSIDFEGIWDGAKDFAKGVTEGLFGATKKAADVVEKVLPDKKVVEVDIETTALEESLDDITVAGKVSSSLKSFSDGVKDFFRGLFSGGEEELGVGAEGIGGKISSAIGKIWTTMSDVTKHFGTATKWLSDPMGTMWANAKSAFKKGGDSLVEVADGFGSKITAAFENVDLVGLLNATGFLSIGLSLLRLSGILKKLTDSVAKVPSSIATMFNSIGTAVLDFGQAAKTSARGNFILKLAVSLGILAVSLRLLANMSWDDLVKGLTATVIALGVLAGASFLSGLGSGVGGGLGAQLALLGAGLLGLYLAIRIFDKIDHETMVNGLKKIAVTLLVLGGIALLLKFAGRKLKDEDSAFSEFANQLIKISIGLSLIALAMLMFKMVDAGSWWKAIGTIITIALTLAGLAAASSKWGLPIATLSKAFLAVALSLLTLAFAMEMIGDLSAGDFAKSAATLVSIIVILGLAAKLFNAKDMAKIGMGLMGLGIGMLSFAASIIILAFAVRILSDLDWSQLTKGLVGVAVLAAVLTGVLLALSRAEKQIKQGAKAVLMLVGAIALLALIVWLFKDTGWEEMKPGLLVIATAGLVLGSLAAMLSTFPTDFKAAGALIVIAGALIVFAVALRILQDIPMEQLAASMGVLMGALFAMVGALAILSMFKTAAVSAVAVVILAAAMVVLAYAFRMLSEADPERLSSAMGALVGTILVMAAVGAILGAYPMLAVGLLAVAAAVAIVAVSLAYSVDIIANAIVKVVDSVANGGDRIMDAFERFGPALERAGEAIANFERTGLPSLQAIFDSLSFGDGVKAFLAGSSIGKMASELELFGSDAMKNAATNIETFAQKIGPFKQSLAELKSIDTSGIQEAGNNLNKIFSEGMLDGIKNAAKDIASAVTSIAEAIKGKGSAFRSAGGKLANDFKGGIKEKVGDAEKAGRELATRAADAAKSKRAAFVEAGRHIASGLAEGIASGKSAAISAAAELAAAAVKAAKDKLDVRSPSRVFRSIGAFVSLGLAQGITRNSKVTERASADMAEGLVSTAESVLQIHSPSRRFQGVGAQVNAGLAGGIKATAHEPKNAMGDALDGVIGAYGDRNGAARMAGDNFVDNLFAAFTNTQHYRQIDRLVKHSQALRATAIKEDKIAREEDIEKKEDEREQIYREIESTRKEIDDARKAQRENEGDAEEAAQKVRDAEKKHRRALSKKERYEYKQYGTEAGVAFHDGVAEGLIDDSKKIPTFAEHLSEVLMEEFEKVKKKANDFVGVFDGLKSVVGNFRNVRDHTNDLRRAFTRLSHSSNPLAFKRNLGHVFDSILAIGKEAVGVLSIMDKLKPFVPLLLQQLQGVLPGIAAAIAPVAPGLAAQLGGGITAALAAITGPVGAAALGVVGAIALVFDSGSTQIVLKFARSIVDGLVNFLKNLPKTLVRFAKTFANGLKNLFVEIPRMIRDLIRGLMFGIADFIKESPKIIVEVIKAFVDAIVGILTETPTILVEIALAIVEALVYVLTDAIPTLIKQLPKMFIDVGKAIIEGLVKGVKNGVSSVFNAFKSFGNGIINTFKRIFRINSPSKVFMEIGKYITEGLAKGVHDGEGEVERSMDDIVKTLLGSLDDNLPPDTGMTIRLTPVIDMDEIEAELRRITQLDTNVTANAAESIRDHEGAFGGVTNNVTNISYTQNNTSPKPLSTIELYRNTEHQLKMLL